MGWAVQDRMGPKQAEVCPYLKLDNIDPRWYVFFFQRESRCLLTSCRHEANGGDSEVLEQQQQEAAHSKAKGYETYGTGRSRPVWADDLFDSSPLLGSPAGLVTRNDLDPSVRQ